MFEHGGHGPFPHPFDLVLEAGWTGVVGPNGVGKSTLLRLIAGELTRATGTIQIESSTTDPIEIGALAQTVEWTPALALALEQLADDWSARAGRLRSRLELDPAQLDRWPTLSPGERKRWQIAAALAAEPAVLLCDEPGNHLDARGRELLLAGLREHAGIGVIVSHDRELLDRLCDATVFLDPGGAVELRSGGYSTALAQRELERNLAYAEFEQAQAHEQRLAAQVQAARERHSQTERSRRVSSRKRDHTDHDASSSARKFRADRASASASTGVRRAQAAHARAHARLDGVELAHPSRASLFVDWQPPPKSVLVSLTLEDLPRFAPHPGTRLPDDRPVTIGRDDRIHVVGDNGSGKSSLLGAVAARARANLGDARILWMPQELDADQRRGLLEQLRRLDSAERGRVLQIVGAAGGDAKALLRTPTPSPGEARKLGLALGLARRAWLLILDEPTNHLDLPAREAVEGMLRGYPGALLITSHDHRFAEPLTRDRWQL